MYVLKGGDEGPPVAFAGGGEASLTEREDGGVCGRDEEPERFLCDDFRLVASCH